MKNSSSTRNTPHRPPAVTISPLVSRGREVMPVSAVATVSALASLPAEAQLRSHLNCCLVVGWSEDQMKAFVAVLETKVGKAEAELAEKALNTVLQNRIQSK